MKALEKQLNKKLQEALLKEDRKPSEGIWYIIWLKPKWVLKAFKDTEYPGIAHMSAWTEYLAPLVADHYKIPLDEVKLLTYAFPRGRVVYQQQKAKEITSMSEMTGKWVFYYGGDLPDNRFKRLIVSAFNLEGMVGRMQWSTDDEHEYMQELDVMDMVSLIGPYLNNTQNNKITKTDAFDD